MEGTNTHPYTRRGWTAIIVILSSRLAIMALWSTLPDLPIKITFGLIIADLCLLGLQIRYGLKAARSITGSPLSWLIWATLLVASTITFSNALDRIANLYVKPPTLVESGTTFEVENGVAIFAGLIDFGAFNALENTLKRHPDLHSIRLTSDGGRIAAARGMARLISEANLSTQGIATCASACTLVFMAGDTRSLAPDARLGFHGYELVSNVITLNTEEEQERDKETFRNRGVSDDFLEKAFAIPHSEMWFPSHQILRAAGVLTQDN